MSCGPSHQPASQTKVLSKLLRLYLLLFMLNAESTMLNLAANRMVNFSSINLAFSGPPEVVTDGKSTSRIRCMHYCKQRRDAGNTASDDDSDPRFGNPSCLITQSNTINYSPESFIIPPAQGSARKQRKFRDPACVVYPMNVAEPFVRIDLGASMTFDQIRIYTPQCFSYCAATELEFDVRTVVVRSETPFLSRSSCRCSLATSIRWTGATRAPV
jgi:hypothetical protein